MAKTKEPKEAAPEVQEPKMSKAAAVREALAQGVEKPQDGAEFVKEKFGVEITPQQFSIYKSQENKKKEGGSTGTRKKKETAPAVSTGGAESVSLARDVKKLVETYGAEAVKGMAEVFAG